MLVGRSAPACGTEGVEVVDRPWQVRLATEGKTVAKARLWRPVVPWPFLLQAPTIKQTNVSQTQDLHFYTEVDVIYILNKSWLLLKKFPLQSLFRMSERPRKVSNSRRLYMCKVPGCTVTPRGCDVSKHYKTKTDWSEVRELKAVAGSAALKAKLEQAEGHTKFAFVNNYSEEHLPTWATRGRCGRSSVGKNPISEECRPRQAQEWPRWLLCS